MGTGREQNGGNTRPSWENDDGITKKTLARKKKWHHATTYLSRYSGPRLHLELRNPHLSFTGRRNPRLCLPTLFQISPGPRDADGLDGEVVLAGGKGPYAHIRGTHEPHQKNPIENPCVGQHAGQQLA